MGSAVSPAIYRVLLALLLCGPVAAGSEARPRLSSGEAESGITAAELKTHLTFIASDKLKGRDPGTDGCRAAAEYLRNEFRACGLEPLGDTGAGGERTFFQKLNVPGKTKTTERGNRLAVHSGGEITPFECGTAYLPLSISANAEVTRTGIAFVGYGITDEDTNYDDYAGLDVKGKAVVMFRYEHGESSAKIYRPSRHAWLVTKAENAIRHGASAVIIVNGPNNRTAGEGDPLIGLSNVGRLKNNKVPVTHAKQKVLAALLEGEYQNAKKLQTFLDRTRVAHSFIIKDKTIDLSVRLKRETRTTRNIIGIARGRHPDLRDECIVIGAHYDHIGLGHYGSRWGGRGRGKVHNGADDNGSGTVGVLELAEAVASLERRPKRSIVFILFTGEERGLIGSRHFVRHPTVPLDRIAVMINLDMIGRSSGGAVTIAGVGTSSVFPDVIKRAADGLDLKIRTQKSGRSPSDNIPFLAKRIPVLFYFTGLHKQYHTPEDDVGRINFAVERRIVRHVMRVALALADHAGGIEYVHVAGRRGVMLGILPNTNRLPAVVVRQVLRGGPADKAGVMPGDVIVEIGGRKINGIVDLRRALSKKKKGDTVGVTVRRKGSEGKAKTVELSLTFF
jgi:hypothetical protein